MDAQTESPLDYHPLSKPGGRFPVKDPGFVPRLCPRPDETADFVHGVLEGSARTERRAYEAMAERGAPWPERIVTAGGGSAQAVWTAIRACVMGVTVSTADTPKVVVGAARVTGLAAIC